MTHDNCLKIHLIVDYYYLYKYNIENIADIKTYSEMNLMN